MDWMRDNQMMATHAQKKHKARPGLRSRQPRVKLQLSQHRNSQINSQIWWPRRTTPSSQLARREP